MSLLSNLLNKRGIETIEELSSEEKEVFQRWQSILTEELTTTSIKEFCRSQIDLIEDKADGITPLTNLQQACIHVYKNLIRLIEAPETERASLELMLTQLINS